MHQAAFASSPTSAAWMLRALLGDMAVLLLASQRLKPRRVLEAGFCFRQSTLDVALADLIRPAA